jgi:hypothetical protein
VAGIVANGDGVGVIDESIDHGGDDVIAGTTTCRRATALRNRSVVALRIGYCG